MGVISLSVPIAILCTCSNSVHSTHPKDLGTALYRSNAYLTLCEISIYEVHGYIIHSCDKLQLYTDREFPLLELAETLSGKLTSLGKWNLDRCNLDI